MEFTHVANPVRVTATEILDVTRIEPPEGCAQSHPDVMLRLADGRNYRADMSMTSRHVPIAGDYLVHQEDGYEYLNPKDVFERKYRAAEREHPLDHIARVCHEVNRAYCQSLGDNSQPEWEDAPAWQRESARMGVDLHMMGDFGPEASHIGWMNQKLNDGWKYGPVKNPDAKEHPCIVPFDQLPREQQAKDFIFRAVVHALKERPAK